MSRLHADLIDVQRRDDAPQQFLWRERLYLVREVLAHWTEAGSWWRGTAARAMTCGDPAGPAPGYDDVGASTGPAALDDREREYWRVEAGPGRSAGFGVYDLCFDWSRNAWTVTRVLD